MNRGTTSERPITSLTLEAEDKFPNYGAKWAGMGKKGGVAGCQPAPTSVPPTYRLLLR